MTGEQPAVDPQDNDTAETFEAALAAFAEELSLFHIACGSPSYATIASASVRPRLTKSGLTEMLTGKRLPSLETLLEFVRVVTTPSGLDKLAAGKFRANPETLKEWRGRWQHVKVLQRRFHRANKRPPTTVKQIHDDVAREPEALHAESDHMVNAAASSERIRTQAQQEDADELSAKEYVRIVEATFDTTIPKEARQTGWLAGSLTALVAVGAVALSWADKTELIVKITSSVMIPLMLWSAVLADITNRRRVLDKGWLVVLMYLMAAFTMGAPVMSYLGNLPAEDEQLTARIAVYAVMLFLI
ncbi:hypothetical protein, partial [Streptomyces sp. NPDC058812]|uniref:hypothetical protein n=1 Tax=Streptomyces sp. NPDC058812 TaxID=3346639 RepID=UPI0036980D1C